MSCGATAFFAFVSIIAFMACITGDPAEAFIAFMAGQGMLKKLKETNEKKWTRPVKERQEMNEASASTPNRKCEDT